MIFKLITLIIIFISPVSTATVSPISAYSETTAAIFTVYESSVTPASSNIQTVTYTTALTTLPEIALGIVGYKENSDLSTTLFTLTVRSNTLASFQIQHDYGGSASVYLIQVSYISIVNPDDNIYVLQKSYTNTDFSSVNQGSGARSQSHTESFYTMTGGEQLNSNTTKNQVATFLIGFEVALTNTLSLSVQTIITNSISFSVSIATSDDCHIRSLKASFIFFDLEPIQGTNIIYYNNVDNIIVSSSESSSLTYSYLSTNHFIYGIYKLEVTPNGAAIQTFFHFTMASSGTYFDLSFNNIVSLSTRFVFLGTRSCPSAYPYYSSPTISLCTDACQDGQTTNPSNYICNSCFTPCETCSLSTIFCETCVDGYEYDDNGTCIESQEPPPPQQPEESFPLWTIGVIVPVVLLLGIGLYCLLRKPPRTLFEEDIRMHPSIDIL